MEPVALYRACPTCEGHGRIVVQTDGPRTELCGKCWGKGRVPTADGQSMMELLRLIGLMDLAPDA